MGERKQEHFDRKPKQEKDGSERKEQDEGVKKVEKRKNENDTNIAPFAQKADQGRKQDKRRITL